MCTCRLLHVVLLYHLREYTLSKACSHAPQRTCMQSLWKFETGFYRIKIAHFPYKEGSVPSLTGDITYPYE